MKSPFVGVETDLQMLFAKWRVDIDFIILAFIPIAIAPSLVLGFQSSRVFPGQLFFHGISFPCCSVPVAILEGTLSP